VQLTEK